MIKFGTGGWRAIIGDEFNRANIRLLAQGLSNRMHREGVVDRGLVISYDRRFLSDVAAWWAIEVFVANGIPVTLIGRPVPTPMGMWTVRNKGCAYGLAVTASHNPALYNGFKLFTEGGRDAELAITDELASECNALTEDDVRSVEAHEAKASELVTVQTSINWYLDAIMDSLDLDVIRHAHLHIILDPMFGVAQTALQTVLLTAGREQHGLQRSRPAARWASSTTGTIRCSAGVCRRRPPGVWIRCGAPSSIPEPPWVSPPTVTPTDWASSTTRATISRPTRCSCCCMNTW